MICVGGKSRARAGTALLAVGLAAAAVGCQPADIEQNQTAAAETATLADYQRAQQFLRPNTDELVYDTILTSYWQDDDRLVYRKRTPQGLQYILADPATGTRSSLLDLGRLATALAAQDVSAADAGGDEAGDGAGDGDEGRTSADDLDATELEISAIELQQDAESISFTHDGTRYRLNVTDYSLTVEEQAEDDEVLSPDGELAAYIDDYNLWLRDLETGTRTQLTFDGEQHYGYATNNAGWTRRDGPVLLWSPDSNRIATFRHDARDVGEMYLYSTEVGHPELDAWKYPLPGDDSIFMIERVVVHVQDPPHLVRLQMPPDPHRSTISDHIAGRGGVFLDVEWSEDSASLAFVSSSRDHQVATLRIADPVTGAVRDVYSETVPTYYESGFRTPNWRVLRERDEFLWFSESDNWGHLYLHDLAGGSLKRQVTAGNWAVLEILHIDSDAGEIYFTGSGREPGNPYYHYLYRTGFDGSGLINLTPEPGHHVISWSENDEVFLDTWSTPTQPPQSAIRNRDGTIAVELETGDISALLASGWIPPEPFTVKARDQQTDLYGLLYQPTNLDEARSYPVLNYLYPGPQSGSVGSRSFQASRRDKQALAELGFIVVEVDAMGTPGRSKAFHDAYYGNMGDNGLPDQMTAIRQLAADRPWMDLERVGIWGHSGGGFASTAGILRYPDFYKVAVSSAGNHDNRNYEDDWGEKWQGLLETYPESNPLADADSGSAALTNYDNQANQLLADQLQGRLLLAHGMMDSNVHPSNTLLVVQALIDAEKDFDLLLIPDADHGFGNSRYFMKRRWDYFVRHLQQAEPPAEFRFADNID